MNQSRNSLDSEALKEISKERKIKKKTLTHVVSAKGPDFITKILTIKQEDDESLDMDCIPKTTLPSSHV